METIAKKRHNKYRGITYYAHFGDKLEDYQNIQVPPSQFVYNCNQHTLVCGECDFSFTASLIRKRGGSGVNLCSTSYYYEKSQWFRQLPQNMKGGVSAFNSFLSNLQYCKNFKAKISFGVDARSLRCGESKWNDNYKQKNSSFDRIIFTFPRRYNKNNENLLLYILKSMKSYLNENGEIHLMLFKEQFWNWHINQIVSELDLKLFYWTQLNKSLLATCFPGYTPRDAWGNKMILENAHIGSQIELCFCSFVRKDYYKFIAIRPAIKPVIQPVVNIYSATFYNPAPIQQHIHIHHHYDQPTQIKKTVPDENKVDLIESAMDISPRAMREYKLRIKQFMDVYNETVYGCRSDKVMIELSENVIENVNVYDVAENITALPEVVNDGNENKERNEELTNVNNMCMMNQSNNNNDSNAEEIKNELKFTVLQLGTDDCGGTKFAILDFCGDLNDDELYDELLGYSTQSIEALKHIPIISCVSYMTAGNEDTFDGMDRDITEYNENKKEEENVGALEEKEKDDSEIFLESDIQKVEENKTEDFCEYCYTNYVDKAHDHNPSECWSEQILPECYSFSAQKGYSRDIDKNNKQQDNNENNIGSAEAAQTTIDALDSKCKDLQQTKRNNDEFKIGFRRNRKRKSDDVRNSARDRKYRYRNTDRDKHGYTKYKARNRRSKRKKNKNTYHGYYNQTIATENSEEYYNYNSNYDSYHNNKNNDEVKYFRAKRYRYNKSYRNNNYHLRKRSKY